MNSGQHGLVRLRRLLYSKGHLVYNVGIVLTTLGIPHTNVVYIKLKIKQNSTWKFGVFPGAVWVRIYCNWNNPYFIGVCGFWAYAINDITPNYVLHLWNIEGDILICDWSGKLAHSRQLQNIHFVGIIHITCHLGFRWFRWMYLYSKIHNQTN